MHKIKKKLSFCFWIDKGIEHEKAMDSRPSVHREPQEYWNHPSNASSSAGLTRKELQTIYYPPHLTADRDLPRLITAAEEEEVVFSFKAIRYDKERKRYQEIPFSSARCEISSLYELCMSVIYNITKNGGREFFRRLTDRKGTRKKERKKIRAKLQEKYALYSLRMLKAEAHRVKANKKSGTKKEIRESIVDQKTPFDGLDSWSLARGMFTISQNKRFFEHAARSSAGGDISFRCSLCHSLPQTKIISHFYNSGAVVINRLIEWRYPKFKESFRDYKVCDRCAHNFLLRYAREFLLMQERLKAGFYRALMCNVLRSIRVARKRNVPDDEFSRVPVTYGAYTRTQYNSKRFKINRNNTLDVETEDNSATSPPLEEVLPEPVVFTLPSPQENKDEVD